MYFLSQIIRFILPLLSLLINLWIPTSIAEGVRTAEAFRIKASPTLRVALDELASAAQTQLAVLVQVSYDASIALVQQLKQGEVAHLVITAGRHWLADDLPGSLSGSLANDSQTPAAALPADSKADRADKKIKPNLTNTPFVAPAVDWVSHTLVVIAAHQQPLDAIPSPFSVVKLLRNGRLAIADPDRVPSGRTARLALHHLGEWAALVDKLDRQPSNQAVIQQVARGEATFGIVYGAEALQETGVRIVGTFPAESYPPLVFTLATTAHKHPKTAELIAFLLSSEAAVIFERHGFRSLTAPSPPAVNPPANPKKHK